jgi:hypothetical protein
MSENKTKLKKLLSLFLDELTEMYPFESDFIVAKILLSTKFSEETVYGYAVSYILPMKDAIAKKDSTAFSDPKNIFVSFGMKAEYFIGLYDKMQPDDQACIWRWFDEFIKLLEK